MARYAIKVANKYYAIMTIKEYAKVTEKNNKKNSLHWCGIGQKAEGR